MKTKTTITVNPEFVRCLKMDGIALSTWIDQELRKKYPLKGVKAEEEKINPIAELRENSPPNKGLQ